MVQEFVLRWWENNQTFFFEKREKVDLCFTCKITFACLYLLMFCLSRCVTFLSTPLCFWLSLSFSLSPSHSPLRLLCHLKLNSSLVFLAARVGIRPGAYAQHELMCLINTTLIICKLHVWVHITWEAYVARRVSRNKWLLNPISGALASVDGPISLESLLNTQKEPHMLRQKKDSQKHVSYCQNPAEANFYFKERLFEVHPLQAAKRNLHPSRTLFAISSGIDDYEYIMKKINKCTKVSE